MKLFMILIFVSSMIGADEGSYSDKGFGSQFGYKSSERELKASALKSGRKSKKRKFSKRTKRAKKSAAMKRKLASKKKRRKKKKKSKK